MSLALFSFDLLLLVIFISKFWDKILLCWFIWFIMILAARVVSVTRLILPCSNVRIEDDTDDTALYSNCDQASDLWQQLELASELESDLRDTVDCGKKWLVNFNAGKTQLVSFDRCYNGSIDVKIDGSVLEEKSYFKMMG